LRGAQSRVKNITELSRSVQYVQSQMPVLTNQQFEQLQALLVESFDKPAIEELVRKKLGDRLENIINTNQSNSKIVFDLLTWTEQRGLSTLEVLLQGAIAERPADGVLRAFCEQIVPGALKPFNSQAFVKSLTSGLNVLISMKDVLAVRETVGQVRAQLERTNEQIDFLKKYKELHDCLHELEVRLPAIADAVARVNEAPARRSLGIYAKDLRWLSERARAAIPNLPSEQNEEIWIPDLNTCAEDIEDARGSIESAHDRLTCLPSKLRRLLNEAPRINTNLAQLADLLKLDSFSKTMDAIAARGRHDTIPDDASLQLSTGSAAVNVLRSRIAQLVREHYEWQFLTTQLGLAETSSDYQPDLKIARWSQFKTKLIALCDRAPREEWSEDLRSLMERWIAASSSAPKPSDTEMTAAEDAFIEFSHACKLRFFDVDKQLKELCSKLTEVATPLTVLLSVIN
jgi:predicted nuclease with TOPRIM domain